MLNTRHSQSGFTLVELMIGVIILGIVAAAGAPALSSWIQNLRIRSAADAIQSGLQLARAEAVHRNSLVRLQLTTAIDDTCALSDTNTSITSNWVVSQDDASNACGNSPSDTVAPRIIQVHSSAEGSSSQVIVSADQTNIVFNGLGRLNTTTNPADATITLSNPAGGACIPAGKMRCLNVRVSTGGQVRMCDPAKASSDPQGC